MTATARQGWYVPTPDDIARLIEAHKGRGAMGDESTIHTDGTDRASGFVRVYCGRGSDAAAILKRCGSMVLEVKETGDDLHPRIDVAAFRGVAGAFRPIDNRGPAMTDAQKAALRGAQ